MPIEQQFRPAYQPPEIDQPEANQDNPSNEVLPPAGVIFDPSLNALLQNHHFQDYDPAQNIEDLPQDRVYRGSKDNPQPLVISPHGREQQTVDDKPEVFKDLQTQVKPPQKDQQAREDQQKRPYPMGLKTRYRPEQEVVENENKPKKKQLIVVSNRLPANMVPGPDGKLVSKATYGGLVTAMTPLLNGSGYEGVWIGWPGTTETEGLEEALSTHRSETGLNLYPVMLDKEEQKIHYLKVSNEILWPLFHATRKNGILEKVNFNNQELVSTYYKVIGDFVPAIKEQVEQNPDAKILVQDYQLLGLGRLVREAGIKQDMGFFLHIPYPPLEILQDERLDQDMVRQFVLDLTYYNLTGFQTKKDVDNYLAAVEHYLPEAKINKENNTIEIADRKVTVGDFLISMDTKGYEERSHSKRAMDMAEAIQADFPDSQVILAGGRLEYTKGFNYLLRALKRAYEKDIELSKKLNKKPELMKKLKLLLYTPLSREEIPAYQELGDEIDQLVKDINNMYIKEYAERYPPRRAPDTGEIIKQGEIIRDIKGTAMYVDGGLPVMHLKHGLEGDIKYAVEKLRGIRPHPSVKDGAELMFREDGLSATDDTVLAIGEEAGTANIVDDSMKIDPLAIEAFADFLVEAADMPLAERKRRMDIIRATVKAYDITDWGHDYMGALEKAAA